MSSSHDERSADAGRVEVIHSPAPMRKRSWFRYLLQFSLRSLLMVITLVAGVCWWYLQPELKDERLGDGRLRLRRQVRTIVLPQSTTPPLVAEKDRTRLISDGSYRIVDLEGQVLVAGTMSRDRPSGWWTTYYTSGRKAVEGKMVRGERTGVWKTWHESGELASEVTYRPLSQVDPERLHRQPQAWPGAIREGSARAWHPSGKLKLEGQYAGDARDGMWSHFDEQGELLERGAYVAGRREGEWTIRDRESGQLTRVAYINGRTAAEHKQLLARLADEMKSADRRLQLSAAKKLEELGSAGAPILQESLREEGEITQLLALRTLLRCGALPEEMDGVFRSLIDHPRRPLGQRAMVAAIVLSQRRGNLDRRLLDRLLSEIDAESGPSELRVELLQTLCQLETRDRPEIFSRLVAAVAEGVQRSPELDIQAAALRDAQLDVSPILSQKKELPALLQYAFGSPDPLVRATVMLAVEQLVERGPPIPDPPGADYPKETRWKIPAELQLLVEQGRSDLSPVVCEQAEDVGIEVHFAFGCCFGAFTGQALPPPAGISTAGGGSF